MQKLVGKMNGKIWDVFVPDKVVMAGRQDVPGGITHVLAGTLMIICLLCLKVKCMSLPLAMFLPER